MTLDVRFKVDGIPVSKGSHDAFPVLRRCTKCRPGKRCGARTCFGGKRWGAAVTDGSGPELEVWQGRIKVAALSARNLSRARMVERPRALALTMIFVLPRPADHWTDSGALTAAGRDRPFPTVKPDCDKVARAVGDAMTGSLVEDDAQTIVTPIGKVYAGWKGWVGVVVHARQVGSYERWVIEELARHGVWLPPDAAQEVLL